MIQLNIPIPTPSLNRTHGAHWSHYLKVRRAWFEEIFAAKCNARVHDMPLSQRASITIERYGRWILDDDNFRGGLKAVIDALKSNGLIADDSPKHITVHAVQHIGKPHRTVIRIEAVA